MINYILLIGGLLGLTSVAAGAYIDHVLRYVVDTKILSMVYIGLHYHELYAVIISAIGLVHPKNNSKLLKLSAWIFILGALLFSFSIYTTALTGTLVWIKLTPIGGTLLMIGWFFLICTSINFIKKN